MTALNVAELEEMTRDALLAEAKEREVSGVSTMRKQDIILRLLEAQAAAEGNVLAGGVLEVFDDSYGFLRGDSLLPAPTDIYVSQNLIRRAGLRIGDYVIGSARPPKQGETRRRRRRGRCSRS